MVYPGTFPFFIASIKPYLQKDFVVLGQDGILVCAGSDFTGHMDEDLILLLPNIISIMPMSSLLIRLSADMPISGAMAL